MDYEDDFDAEKELVLLNRKLRLIENKKRSIFLNENKIIWQQEKRMKKLADEREDMRKNLETSNCNAHKNSDIKANRQLQEIIEKQNRLQDAIITEKRKMKEADEKIRFKEKAIIRLRKQMGNMSEDERLYQKLVKQSALLENSIYNANIRNNEVIAKVLLQREEVQEMLHWKVSFNDMYKKLSKQLVLGKNIIAKIVKMADKVYDFRKLNRNKIRAIKDRNESDKFTVANDVKDMERHVHYNRELRDFVKQKSFYRPDIYTQFNYLNKKTDSMNKDMDPELRIRNHESMLIKIRQMCQGCPAIDVVSYFLNLEDKNFILFNFINEEKNELERLENKLLVSTKNFEDLCESEDQIITNNSVLRVALETELHQVTQAVDHVETKLTACKDTMRTLQDGITDLFELSNCDPSCLIELLGGKDGMDEHSIFDYMTLLENHLCELILLWNYMNYKPKSIEALSLEKYGEETASNSSMIIGPDIPEPPPIGDKIWWEADDTIHFSRPMSRPEFQEVAHRQISRDFEQVTIKIKESSIMRWK